MGKKPWIIGGLVICIGALAVLGGSLLVGGNRHGQTVVKTAGTVAGVNMAAPEKTVEQELKAKAGENAENGPIQVTTAAVEETETVEAQAGDCGCGYLYGKPGVPIYRPGREGGG